MASGTRETILNAAEKLFAEQGFDATSLRQVIGAAKVNIASVHYHFGSREELIKAVLSRRLSPMNQERLALLDQLESQAGRRPLELERLLEAFVGPPLRLSRDPRKGQAFMRLAGRALAEPNPVIQTMFTEQFREIARRFIAAFARAVPELNPTELFWRTHFGVGAMVHTLMFGPQLKGFSGGLCDVSDTEAVIRRLVQFMTAGMRAGIAPKKGGKR